MTYTINVWNSALSTDVPPSPWLTDTLPLSVTLVSISNGGISQTIGSRTVISWALPAMGPGDIESRSFTVQVDDDLVSGTQIINDDYRTLWYQDKDDAFYSNSGQPVTTTVVEVGLIDSYKEVDPALSLPGPNVVLTYYLHIVNSSVVSLTNVQVYDYLPWEHSTYQKDAVASGGALISDIVSLQWSGGLAPLSSETVTMTVLVDAYFKGALTNTAVISHPELLDDVVVEAVAYVTDEPVLKITKSASPDPVGIGEELTYRIWVQNLGQQATGLVITDAIPSNTEYVDGSASAGTQFAGGQLQWDVSVLKPGQGRTLDFRVLVNSGFEVVNEAYRVTSAEGVMDVGEPVVTPIIPSFGVELDPPTDSLSGDPGETVTYTLRLTNTGNISDTYDLTTTGNTWVTSIQPSTVGPLDPGEGTDVDVFVSIPVDAAQGDSDIATITALSQSDPAESDTSVLTTTVNTVYGVVLEPPTASIIGGPGETVTYTLRLTNTGNTTDTFDLAASGNTWVTGVQPPTVGPLSPGEGADVVVTVAIPAGTADGDTDVATITATSLADASASDSSVLTTTASALYGVVLEPPTDSLSGSPGETVTYTLRLTNTGNASDSFDLTATGNVWVTNIQPATAGPLAPGAGVDVVVTVAIPVGTASGASDVATITATSLADSTTSDSSVLTTTVSAVYGVILEPPTDALTGGAGETVVYTLRLTNTGDVADSFDLTATGNAWVTNVQPATVGPLAPGEGVDVVVTVTIPAGVADGDTDAVTITATSQSDPTVTDTSVLTTTGMMVDYDVYLPLIQKG
jgi:uncharacterized repeat protein (TIGR01451 family)